MVSGRTISSGILLVTTLITHVDAAESAPKEQPYVLSQGERIPSPLRIELGGWGPGIGNADAIQVILTNYGKETIRLPLLPMINGEPMVRVKFTKRDGAEPVTYPYECGWVYGMRRQPPTFPALLSVSPGRAMVLLSSPFVLWEPGEYHCRVELRNRFTTHLGGGESPSASQGPEVRPIPNVWVGCVVFESDFTLETIDLELLPKSQALLKRLSGDALTKDKSLGDRCRALTSLVEMRHVYATEALSAIEKESRGDAGFHLFVVKALCDITYHGTGYRCLSVFAELALDGEQPLPVQMLCADVLMTVAHSKDLRHGTRVFHVISSAEKTTAAEAIQKLEAMRDRLPKEMRGLLSKQVAE